MTTFGLICEGPSDQEVIENILTGYFKSPDIQFNPLQPLGIKRINTGRKVSAVGIKFLNIVSPNSLNRQWAIIII